MAYEKYKKISSKKEFYKEWELKQLDELTDYLKECIYQKHVMKAKTLQRDNFTCQNYNCENCNNVQFYNKLTIHHIKFKKNKGEDKKRNAVTLCNNSHNGYHKAKSKLIFSLLNKNLPSHIRGHTFKLQKPDKIDWKELRAQGEKIRKELKAKGFKSIIDWDEIWLLLRWVFTPFDEIEDD